MNYSFLFILKNDLKKIEYAMKSPQKDTKQHIHTVKI